MAKISQKQTLQNPVNKPGKLKLKLKLKLHQRELKCKEKH